MKRIFPNTSSTPPAAPPKQQSRFKIRTDQRIVSLNQFDTANESHNTMSLFRDSSNNALITLEDYTYEEIYSNLISMFQTMQPHKVLKCHYISRHKNISRQLWGAIQLNDSLEYYLLIAHALVITSLTQAGIDKSKYTQNTPSSIRIVINDDNNNNDKKTFSDIYESFITLLAKYFYSLSGHKYSSWVRHILFFFYKFSVSLYYRYTRMPSVAIVRMFPTKKIPRNTRRAYIQFLNTISLDDYSLKQANYRDVTFAYSNIVSTDPLFHIKKANGIHSIYADDGGCSDIITNYYVSTSTYHRTFDFLSKYRLIDRIAYTYQASQTSQTSQTPKSHRSKYLPETNPLFLLSLCRSIITEPEEEKYSQVKISDYTSDESDDEMIYSTNASQNTYNDYDDEDPLARKATCLDTNTYFMNIYHQIEKLIPFYTKTKVQPPSNSKHPLDFNLFSYQDVMNFPRISKICDKYQNSAKYHVYRECIEKNTHVRCGDVDNDTEELMTIINLLLPRTTKSGKVYTLHDIVLENNSVKRVDIDTAVSIASIPSVASTSPPMSVSTPPPIDDIQDQIPVFESQCKPAVNLHEYQSQPQLQPQPQPQYQHDTNNILSSSPILLQLCSPSSFEQLSTFMKTPSLQEQYSGLITTTASTLAQLSPNTRHQLLSQASLILHSDPDCAKYQLDYYFFVVSILHCIKYRIRSEWKTYVMKMKFEISKIEYKKEYDLLRCIIDGKSKIYDHQVPIYTMSFGSKDVTLSDFSESDLANQSNLADLLQMKLEYNKTCQYMHIEDEIISEKQIDGCNACSVNSVNSDTNNAITSTKLTDEDFTETEQDVFAEFNPAYGLSNTQCCCPGRFSYSTNSPNSPCCSKSSSIDDTITTVHDTMYTLTSTPFMYIRPWFETSYQTISRLLKIEHTIDTADISVGGLSPQMWFKTALYSPHDGKKKDNDSNDRNDRNDDNDDSYDDIHDDNHDEDMDESNDIDNDDEIDNNNIDSDDDDNDNNDEKLTSDTDTDTDTDADTDSESVAGDIHVSSKSESITQISTSPLTTRHRYHVRKPKNLKNLHSYVLAYRYPIISLTGNTGTGKKYQLLYILHRVIQHYYTMEAAGGVLPTRFEDIDRFTQRCTKKQAVNDGRYDQISSTRVQKQLRILCKGFGGPKSIFEFYIPTHTDLQNLSKLSKLPLNSTSQSIPTEAYFDYVFLNDTNLSTEEENYVTSFYPKDSLIQPTRFISATSNWEIPEKSSSSDMEHNADMEHNDNENALYNSSSNITQFDMQQQRITRLKRRIERMRDEKRLQRVRREKYNDDLFVNAIESIGGGRNVILDSDSESERESENENDSEDENEDDDKSDSEDEDENEHEDEDENEGEDDNKNEDEDEFTNNNCNKNRKSRKNRKDRKDRKNCKNHKIKTFPQDLRPRLQYRHLFKSQSSIYYKHQYLTHSINIPHWSYDELLAASYILTSPTTALAASTSSISSISSTFLNSMTQSFNFLHPLAIALRYHAIGGDVRRVLSFDGNMWIPLSRSQVLQRYSTCDRQGHGSRNSTSKCDTMNDIQDIQDIQNNKIIIPLASEYFQQENERHERHGKLERLKRLERPVLHTNNTPLEYSDVYNTFVKGTVIQHSKGNTLVLHPNCDDFIRNNTSKKTFINTIDNLQFRDEQIEYGEIENVTIPIVPFSIRFDKMYLEAPVNNVAADNTTTDFVSGSVVVDMSDVDNMTDGKTDSMTDGMTDDMTDTTNTFHTLHLQPTSITLRDSPSTGIHDLFQLHCQQFIFNLLSQSHCNSKLTQYSPELISLLPYIGLKNEKYSQPLSQSQPQPQPLSQSQLTSSASLTLLATLIMCKHTFLQCSNTTDMLQICSSNPTVFLQFYSLFIENTEQFQQSMTQISSLMAQFSDIDKTTFDRRTYKHVIDPVSLKIYDMIMTPLISVSEVFAPWQTGYTDRDISTHSSTNPISDPAIHCDNQPAQYFTKDSYNASIGDYDEFYNQLTMYYHLECNGEFPRKLPKLKQSIKHLTQVYLQIDDGSDGSDGNDDSDGSDDSDDSDENVESGEKEGNNHKTHITEISTPVDASSLVFVKSFFHFSHETYEESSITTHIFLPTQRSDGILLYLFTLFRNNEYIMRWLQDLFYHDYTRLFSWLILLAPELIFPSGKEDVHEDVEAEVEEEIEEEVEEEIEEEIESKMQESDKNENGIGKVSNEIASNQFYNTYYQRMGSCSINNPVEYNELETPTFPLYHISNSSYWLHDQQPFEWLDRALSFINTSTAKSVVLGGDLTKVYNITNNVLYLACEVIMKYILSKRTHHSIIKGVKFIQKYKKDHISATINNVFDKTVFIQHKSPRSTDIRDGSNSTSTSSTDDVELISRKKLMSQKTVIDQDDGNIMIVFPKNTPKSDDESDEVDDADYVTFERNGVQYTPSHPLMDDIFQYNVKQEENHSKNNPSAYYSESESEHESEHESEPGSEHGSEHESESGSEPESESKPESVSELGSEPGSERESEPGSESEPESQPESQPEPESEPGSESESDEHSSITTLQLQYIESILQLRQYYPTVATEIELSTSSTRQQLNYILGSILFTSQRSTPDNFLKQHLPCLARFSRQSIETLYYEIEKDGDIRSNRDLDIETFGEEFVNSVENKVFYKIVGYNQNRCDQTSEFAIHKDSIYCTCTNCDPPTDNDNLEDNVRNIEYRLKRRFQNLKVTAKQTFGLERKSEMNCDGYNNNGDIQFEVIRKNKQVFPKTVKEEYKNDIGSESSDSPDEEIEEEEEEEEEEEGDDGEKEGETEETEEYGYMDDDADDDNEGNDDGDEADSDESDD